MRSWMPFDVPDLSSCQPARRNPIPKPVFSMISPVYSPGRIAFASYDHLKKHNGKQIL